MYPKVKVRALVDDDDDYDFPIIRLQGFDSLSVRDSSPPVKGVKHSSSVSVAKVPSSYVPRSMTPPPSLPKSAKTSELEADGKKTHIRASSIPRPRAVISSPDNDQILGSKNKTRLRRPSAIKNPNLAQSRQSEGSICTRMITTSKKPLKRSECKVATHTSDVQDTKESALDIRVPITNISKAKPCFLIT